MLNRILIATLVAIALIPNVRPAEACSPPLPYVEVRPPAGDLVSPAEGFVALSARLHEMQTEDLEATLEVLDTDGEPVAGSWEQQELSSFGLYAGDTWGRTTDVLLVWRAEEGLTPGGTYTAQLTTGIGENVNWGGDPPTVTTFPMTVTEETPVFVPQAHLFEPELDPGATLTMNAHWTPTTRTCCPVDYECIGACDAQYDDQGRCAVCWGTDYAYRPLVSASLPLDTRFHDRVLYELVVETDDGNRKVLRTLSRGSEVSVRAYYDDFNEDYCVSLKATDLLTGEIATTGASCLGIDAMPELEPQPEPDYTSDLNQCAELPEGWDENGPIEDEVHDNNTGSTGGDNTGGDTTGGGNADAPGDSAGEQASVSGGSENTGCAVTSTGQRGGLGFGAAGWLLLLGALWARRR